MLVGPPRTSRSRNLVVVDEPGGRLRVGTEQPFVFRMKVFNHGPADATGIVARNFLPAGLQPLEAFLSQGSFDLQTGFWTVGDLPQGGMAQLDLYVVAAQLGSFQNTLARIASAPIDPNAANDVSSAGFEVTAGTDGAYVRYYSEGATGDFFTTTYSLTNPNPFAANVSFRFQRPTGGEVTHALDAGAVPAGRVRSGDDHGHGVDGVCDDRGCRSPDHHDTDDVVGSIGVRRAPRRGCCPAADGVVHGRGRHAAAVLAVLFAAEPRRHASHRHHPVSCSRPTEAPPSNGPTSWRRGAGTRSASTMTRRS